MSKQHLLDLLAELLCSLSDEEVARLFVKLDWMAKNETEPREKKK